MTILEVLAILVIVVIVAAAIACLVLMGKLEKARAELDRSQLNLSQAVDVNNQWQDTKKRLEMEILNLKEEISNLEKDVDACQDPTVVRDRLRRLLTSADSGQSSTNQLPNGASSERKTS